MHQVLRIHARLEGAHVKARVWVGQDGYPGFCGELTMRPDEFAHFRAALRLGEDVTIAYQDKAFERVNRAEAEAVAAHEWGELP